MRNRMRIYWILWKQYLLKYRLWIIFLTVAAVLAGMTGQEALQEKSGIQGIAVGIYWEDEKGYELLTGLEGEEGIFRFSGYTDEEEMIRQVENGALECGFALPKDFYDNLLKGKSRRLATLYYSPASSAHRLSYEVVFAELFEILSEDILEEYLREEGYGQDNGFEEAKERLLSLNSRYALDGSTFHFVYERAGAGSGNTPENLNTFRGCIGVMIFLMCLLGLGNTLEQKNTWGALPGAAGRRFKWDCIHVAVSGSVLTGGSCLLAHGILTGRMDWKKEAAALLVYFIALEIYIRILSLFIKSSRALYGLLPILILGSCLFSPVFIRMENYLPAAAWVSKLFPVSCYLELFF